MDDAFGTLNKLRNKIQKEEQRNANFLKVGDILFLPLDEDDSLILKDGFGSRNKYAVIIGFTLEENILGYFVVNTHIHPSKSNLIAYQYPLLRKNYPHILDYDSWLDCTDLFEIRKDRISAKGGMLKGTLIKQDFQAVQDLFKRMPLIDKATKKRFGLY